jgi:hypothetical protein
MQYHSDIPFFCALVRYKQKKNIKEFLILIKISFIRYTSAAKGPNYFLIIYYKMETYQYLLEKFNINHENGENNEHLAIYRKAADDFMYRKIQSNMSIAFELKKLSPLMDKLYDERQKLKEEQAKRLGTLWLWLTVSPNDKVLFEDFQKKVSQYAERKMFKDYFYVYEQRGQHKEEIGKGFHCHFLLKRNIMYKQNKIISNSKNSFKNMTEVNNFQIFNYHWCPDEYLKDKLEYMQDMNKHGQEKNSKQLMDILFRQEKNLNNYYKKECLEENSITA